MRTISKKFLFIDTNIFIDAITSNDGKKILDSLLKQLRDSKVVLVLPEVIKEEIITQYTYWKREAVEKIKGNLSIRRILGIEDITKDKNKKTQQREAEAERIDSVIFDSKNELLKKIENYYKSISKSIETIFKQDNSKIIALTDQILLAGMKRSLLKKSPYTRTEKSTENAHTKDIDCIAFETIIHFCKKTHEKNRKNNLIMCVSDTDYISNDGDLRKDIQKEIKNMDMKYKCYKYLSEMLKEEFNVKIKKESSKNIEAKGKENLTLSPHTGVVESSSDPKKNIFI